MASGGSVGLSGAMGGLLSRGEYHGGFGVEPPIRRRRPVRVEIRCLPARQEAAMNVHTCFVPAFIVAAGLGIFACGRPAAVGDTPEGVPTFQVDAAWPKFDGNW